MKNASYNTLRVKTVCEKKLNIQFRDCSEYNGWFIYEGTRITRVTVPYGRKPIPPKTSTRMADQLKLSISGFDSLLDCPMKLKQYIESLQKQGLLCSAHAQ